jgi:hypothetical protein
VTESARPSTAPPRDAAQDQDARPRDTLDDPVEAAQPPGAKRGARAFQLGAFALLAAAGGLVMASSAPAIAREMGVTDVRVVSRDFARSAPAGQAGVDAVRDFEKGIGRSVAELDLEDDDTVIRPSPRGDRAQLGEATRDVVLRESPKKSAPEIGTAKKGQALVVLRRERDWVQVVHPADRRGLGVGWVPERDIEMP